MFNWPLFTILVLVCIPGLIVATPGSIAIIEKQARAQSKSGQQAPSRSILILAALVQSVVLVLIAAAVGVALAPRVGLGAPVFEALVTAGESAWRVLQPQLLPAIVLGLAGAVLFVAAYYWAFRPRLDAPTLAAIESMRMSLGMPARILYGGVVEEILMRWGLMTLLAWLGAIIVGDATDYVMWAAIIIAGILFGLSHTPAVVAAGARKSPLFFVAEIGLNLWAAVIFGWLYWQYGLAAAMIAHMLFHIVWYPFDQRYAESNPKAK
ncbi:MAG: CPBP family intramembrane metalloprotease [Chloroflexi bacterium]|nr:CPBP family intramembrane metalloprotease [Chloroflexota bacterium]